MREKLAELLESVRKFPKSSGVYIMRNDKGRIIYVGKAKVLRRRVSDYFLKEQNQKTNALLTHIDSIDYIITSSEYEALILENNLIKKHKPHYNIDLKDDKTYAMLKITNEDYPKILKTRRKTQDGGKYFGPYPKSEDLDVFLQIVESNFQYRRCKRFRKLQSPCLYYHIGKCPGPCFQDYDAAEYRKQINRIERFLNGDSDDMRKLIEKRMNGFSKEMDFENALIEKRKLDVIDKFQSLQSVGNISEKKDIDYIGAYKKDDLVFIYIMQYRNSNLLGAASYWSRTLAREEDVFFDFLMQYYTSSDEVPDRIEFAGEYDRKLLSEYFSKNLKDILVSDARSKKDFRILELARMNARDSYEKYMRKKNLSSRGAEDRPDESDESEETDDFGGIDDFDDVSPDADRFSYSDSPCDAPIRVRERENDGDFLKFLKSFSGIGDKRARAICESYSSADELLSDDIDSICTKTGLSRKAVEKMVRLMRV